MMEIIQTILMIVGAIALLWLLVKIIKGVPVVLGEFLEAGFRNSFPYDFMMYFEWIVSEMKLRGYNEVREEDAGSEYPGLIMKKRGNWARNRNTSSCSVAIRKWLQYHGYQS